MAATFIQTANLIVFQADSPSVFERLQTLSISNPQAYNAIVRPNDPPAGIGGFLFDIPGDEEVRFKSAITRHFVENNTPISDHIALEPEMVTVRGLVAELVSHVPTQQPRPQTPNVLPILPVMTPPLTPAQTAAAASTAAGTAMQTQSRASQQSLYQYFKAQEGSALSGLSRQSQAALYFQQAWWGRQLFSVETPWGIWTNMAISEVRMLQSKESRYISDFAIIFERIRVAGDITVALTAGRNADQQSPPSTNGASSNTPATATQANAALNVFNPSAN